MQTDHELLELAAKAAGVDPTPRHVWLHKPPFGFTAVYPACLVHEGKTWIPLTDDGDALRLATKLYLMVDIRDDGAHTFVLGDYGLNTDELHGDDSGAATRRAIVRAAAEIGAHPKQHNDGGAEC